MENPMASSVLLAAPILKTIAQWRQHSGANLSDFLFVGDFVDENFAMWALEILPPAYYTSSTIQIGEPYDHINGRATFTTFFRTPGHPWQYRGHCHRGMITEPGKA
jgi:hypothetical protein